MDKTTQYIRDRLETVINDLMCEIEKEYGAESGDITPAQSLLFDDPLNKLAGLMAEVVEQNAMEEYEVEFTTTVTVKAKSKEAAYAEAKEQLTEDDLWCYIDGKEY